MKLSDREWGEFRISDIFNQKRGKEPAPKQVSDYGKTPIVNEISTNNGIFKFGKGKYLINGNTITVSVNFAKNVFYQKCSFYASVNIIALCSQYLNEYVGKFFSTVICKSNILYNYSYKTSKDRLNTTKILLPTTPQGTPDYDFMEDYIKELMSKKRQKYIEYVKEKMEDLKTVVGGGCVLNDREWREFRIEELFDICLSKGDNQANLLNIGNIPLVSAGSVNNGICKYIKNGDGISQIFNGNIITVDMFGKIFYQPYKFYSVSHGRINILIPKIFLNKHILLFFVNILEKRFDGKYSFANMCSKKRLEREKILLPTTPQGDPDYEFMENYIKELMSKKRQKYIEYVKEKMEDLKTVVGGGCVLNDREWREFRIEELFDICLSKGDNQANLLNIGNIPLVSAGSVNNGICKYIKNGDGISQIFNGNIITVDMFGKIFYQPYKFYSVSHGRINILIPKIFLNKHILLFFVNILEKRFDGKYSFANMCSKKRLEREKILLPTTLQGTPDYEFMENYTKRLIYNKLLKYLEYITKATKN